MAGVNVSSITETFYDFIEMKNKIDDILGYDQRDAGKHFYPDSGSMIEYHKMKGHDVNSNDPEYNAKIHTMYTDAVSSGEWKEKPYMDFWHWQLDHCMNHGFSNDSYSSFTISMDCAKDAEDWQKEIQQVWHDTFKHLADEDGTIQIWVSW